MHRLLPGLCALGLCALLASCSSNDKDSNDSGTVAVQLDSSDPACASQRAEVPSAGVVSQNVVATGSDTQRTVMSEYVSYEVTSAETRLYLSFAPTLPIRFSTDEARAAFQYAYVSYALKQPADIGGSLTLLDSGELLALSDFERFEVIDGVLYWRLVRASASHYVKQLSIYDADTTNDPPDPESCTGGGDIQGLCNCEFSGPPIRVTVEGSLPAE